MRILVTGANGFVGSNIVKTLKQLYFDVYSPSHTELELANISNIKRYFTKNLIDCVIHCASKVGGIGAHTNKHLSFFYYNNQINLNVVEACREWKIKLIALSSVAAFPGNGLVLKEDTVNDGEVHSSERGYALSKRIIDQHIQMCIEEDGSDFSCLFPVNIYGPNDNFDLETGHCIASLMHRMHIAKINNTTLTVWGDGLSLRQFIYVDDLVGIIFGLLSKRKLPNRLLIGNNTIYNIRNVVDLLTDIMSFKNEIFYDKNKPNGLRARICDFNESAKEGLQCQTPLSVGLQRTYESFRSSYEK